jgi:hypothetical protein
MVVAEECVERLAIRLINSQLTRINIILTTNELNARRTIYKNSVVGWLAELLEKTSTQS